MAKAIGKRARNLIICGVSLLVVTGALLALLLFPQAEEEAPSGESTNMIELFVGNTSDIDTLTVINEKGGFVGKIGDGGTLIIPSIEELPLIASSISTLSGRSARYLASEMITDETSRAAEFGLNGTNTVHVKMKDGTEFSIEFGALAPTGTGYYAMTGGKIYLMPSYMAEPFLMGESDYVSLELTPAVDLENEAVTYATMTLDGTLRSEQVVMERVSEVDQENTLVSVEFVTGDKGIRTSVSGETFNTVLNLSATGVAKLFPSEADLKKYGLDEPYSVVKFELYADEEQTTTIPFGLSLSEPADGKCYAMLDGVDVVYEMNFPKNSMFDIDYGTMINHMPVIPYIDKLSDIYFEYADGSHHFELSGEGDDLVIVSGGETLDTAYFRKFYSSMLSINGDEFIEDELDPDELGSPLLTITYKYRDSKKSDDVFEVYEGPLRRYYLSVNGEIDFLSNRQKTETAIENCEKILRGEEVVF